MRRLRLRQAARVSDVAACRHTVLPPAGLVDVGQQRLVRREFVAAGQQHRQLELRRSMPVSRDDALPPLSSASMTSGVLPARHAQVDLGQQPGVEQRAVQVALLLSTSSRLHSASSELLLPGNSSRAISRLSVTRARACARRGGPSRSNSASRKPTSKRRCG